MGKYLELKKIIEEFLELRKKTKEEMDLKDSNGLFILEYLNFINHVIYEKGQKFSEDLKQEIKHAIREWSIYRTNYGQYDPLEDYNLLFKNSLYWKDKEKAKKLWKINSKLFELIKKIIKISTEIFEKDIYPFEND